MARKGFNWSGITENDDGTFTTKSKIEKKRLLKALHMQGIAVRSRKNEDRSWTVTPVGSVRPTKRRKTQMGYRRKTYFSDRSNDQYVTTPKSSTGRYTPVQGRYVPIGGRMRRHPGGPGIRPINNPGNYPGYHGSMRGGVVSTISNMRKARRERLEKERKDREELKKTEQELNEKMRKERIEKEKIQAERDRRNAAIEVQRNEEKARLTQESQRFEQEQRRQQEARRTDQTRQRHAEFQASRDEAKRQRESKIDWVLLENERNNQVTGD